MTQAEQDAREFICHKYDEINEKRWGTWKWKDVMYSSMSRMSFNQIADWMEQYRNEGLREELIKFLSYYHFTINDEQKHGFLTTVVDEYLSNKQKP